MHWVHELSRGSGKRAASGFAHARITTSTGAIGAPPTRYRGWRQRAPRLTRVGAKGYNCGLPRGGAVWQLVGLITRRSQVQILPPQPSFSRSCSASSKRVLQFLCSSLSAIGFNQRRLQMASITRRRNGDGSTSWDALVRVVGFPATCKSFRTKLAAELWSARTETCYRSGRSGPTRLTLAQLLDDRSRAS